jgi:ABC-type polysaccharide/polyol phosphate export permease
LNERLKVHHEALVETGVSQNRWDQFDRDLALGIQAWPLWISLGWNDIRLRYRRSVLGPFWITLSMGVLVVALGFLYSGIFQTDVATYLPYVAIGFIVWTFISSTINESCGAFQEGERIIKQIKLPFSIFVLRVVWRNFIVFLHTIILLIPIAIIFKTSPHLTTLLVLPGVALLYVNLIWIGVVVGILSSRFRDFPQIVTTVLQIGMFATPIMWPVSSLKGNTLIADINPAFHLLQLVRVPLTEGVPPVSSWAVAIGLAVFGTWVAASLLRRTSRRIVYWL